jgi:hypothetical protein
MLGMNLKVTTLNFLWFSGSSDSPLGRVFA